MLAMARDFRDGVDLTSSKESVMAESVEKTAGQLESARLLAS
jgi:hypothetical protein